MYAPIALSFGIALAVGFFAQRSRFCTVAGMRDTILIKDIHLLLGIFALIIAAFATNLALDQLTMGFEDQPVAHTDHLWNYMGMVVAGLAFVLAGGCPGRQLVLSGEGDADAGIFIMGMITGAAFSHNFRFASSPAGTGEWGPAAVIFGLIVCILIGFFLREKN
jgi:YedE family putative selenium metabolism protein